MTEVRAVFRLPSNFAADSQAGRDQSVKVSVSGAKLDVSARSSVINRQDDLKQASLTRDDVAKRLDVSVPTVRRFEGTKLHPIVTGVRRFKPADVEHPVAYFSTCGVSSSFERVAS